MNPFLPFTIPRRIAALAMASLLLAAGPGFAKDHGNEGNGDGKHAQKEYQKPKKQAAKEYAKDRKHASKQHEKAQKRAEKRRREARCARTTPIPTAMEKAVRRDLPKRPMVACHQVKLGTGKSVSLCPGASPFTPCPSR